MEKLRGGQLAPPTKRGGVGAERFSRKEFLKRVFVLGLAATSARAMVPIVKMFPFAELNGQLTQDTLAFLSVPNLNTLRNECHHANFPLTLDGKERGGEEEYRHVSLYIFGDSMNLPNGIRYTSQGPNQLESWGHYAVDKANDYFKKTGIKGEWTQINQARPGSSTQGLSGTESPDGNVQLGNKDVQREIVTDPNTPIIAIGVNGNNWRESGKRALDLYNNVDGKSPHFKDFMDKIDLMGNNNASLVDKLHANGAELLHLLVDDHVLAQQIDGLFKLIQKDTADFERGFQKSLDIVTKLNHERKEAGKTEIKLAVTLPINMQLRDVVPYTPPNAPRDQRGKFEYGQIPNASGAVYRITAAIYTSINQQLRAYENKDEFPQFTTIPFLGFEANPYLFAADGHFAPIGEENVGDEFLRHVSKAAQTLLSLFNGNTPPRRGRTS